MRNWRLFYSWLSVIMVCVVCCAQQTPIIIKRAPVPTVTNIPPEELARMVAEQNQRLNKMVGVTPDMTPEQVRQKVADWAAKMSAQEQHPIVFYGRTVDESNRPLTGANVHLSLNGGLAEKDLQSDADGTFYISDLVGKLLVIDVSKAGYYTSKSNRIDFDYTTYQPNPLQPEIFHLRKKGVGTELITSKSGFTSWFDVQAPIDGTPIWVDLLNRNSGGNGQIKFSSIKAEYLQAKQATEWSFKMEIPDGGFIEENDEFPFDAPGNGYQPVVQFNFQKGQPNWTWNLEGNYFIKFGNPPRYGYFHLETSIGSGVRLTYAINADGSRYLEPKN